MKFALPVSKDNVYASLVTSLPETFNVNESHDPEAGTFDFDKSPVPLEPREGANTANVFLAPPALLEHTNLIESVI